LRGRKSRTEKTCTLAPTIDVQYLFLRWKAIKRVSRTEKTAISGKKTIGKEALLERKKGGEERSAQATKTLPPAFGGMSKVNKPVAG